MQHAPSGGQRAASVSLAALLQLAAKRPSAGVRALPVGVYTIMMERALCPDRYGFLGAGGGGRGGYPAFGDVTNATIELSPAASPSATPGVYQLWQLGRGQGLADVEGPPIVIRNDGRAAAPAWLRPPSYLAAPGAPPACPTQPTALLAYNAPGWAGGLWRLVPWPGNGTGLHLIVRNLDNAT